MRKIARLSVAATLALAAAAWTAPSLVVAQGAAPSIPAPGQPNVPMGPTKAGPGAAVTGSTTAAGNSGAPPLSTTSRATPTVKPAAPGTAAKLSSSDKAFMTKAAEAGHAEIVTGKIAQANGAHPDVKKFGDHMVTDHTKAGDELKALAQAKGVTLPESPDRSHQRMAKQLQNLTGDNFDRVYAREAGVKDHKNAVALFSREARSGTDPDVRAFAAKTLPKLQEHLQMAQALHDAVMKK